MVNRTLRRMLRLSIPLLLPRFRSHRRTIALGKNNQPIVNMVTSWDQRCGIFAYSNFLMNELRKITTLSVVEILDNHALNPYFATLGFTIGRSNALVHVQFAYGEFSDLKVWKFKRLSTFTALLFYGGLAFGKAHVVTTFHELMKEARTGGRAGAVYSKVLNKLICNVSDLIIVHTEESRKLMQTVYGVDASKVKVIPMGIMENPKFLDKAECKRKLGLSGKQIILLPGFVSRHKGHDLIVRILPQLDRNVQLIIAGGHRTSEDAAYMEEVKKLAQQLGCADRITYNDDFPIPTVILNATDIALLPYTSASESMALRLLAAYQVPTATSDLSVFRELYEKYGCMTLFKKGDLNDLLAKTETLLKDEKERQRLRAKCKEMWSATKWSSIAGKHVETYMEVYAGHPDTLYASEMQQERLGWLKENLTGDALEIGCATGYVTNYAGARIGLDINVNRLRLAKKRYPGKEFVLSNSLFLPFVDKTFDTVLIPEILEHLPMALAEKIIVEAKRVGNKILITLPNADKVNYDKSLVETPEHIWYPTRDLVEKLVKGCRIEYTREEDFMLVSS